MKTVFALLFTSVLATSFTQDPLIEDVKAYYNIGNGLQCTASIHIDVPGMIIPDKTIFIEMVPGKKPKIKGAGLVFLPKKGLTNQFDELLAQEAHIINMGNSGDTSVLKLVAIDPKSDWVTADVYIMRELKRIEKTVIQSRENGEYTIVHDYGGDHFPQKSTISFLTEQFKLPLQLMNRAKKADVEQDGPVVGKIILSYSDYVFL